MSVCDTSCVCVFVCVCGITHNLLNKAGDKVAEENCAGKVKKSSGNKDGIT